jgi:hypothetical protein
METTAMKPLDIVGMTEIAAMLNVNVGAVKTWNRRGHLPAPDARLSCGPIWQRSTIERWRNEAGSQRVNLLQKLGEAA